MSQIQTTVPEGETPAGVCEYCGQPFPTSDRLTLHRGLQHLHQLNESQQESFESTVAAERDDLRTLRLRALGVLVLVYFGFLFLYAIFA